MSFQVFGIAVSRGVAIGRAVLVASSRVDVAHYFVAPDQIQAEIARLLRGRDAVVQELETLKDELPDDAPHELAALLDVHLMLLHDEALTGSASQWIVDRHYNAEWALSAQLEVLARQFDEMEDDYLRERKADLEQVVERVLGALAQAQGDAPAPVTPRDFAGEDPLLLVAADIAPADMIQFKRSVFRGFITDIGGKTSHTAIVARSMDIPAVVGTREASRLIMQDDWVIIDGDAGTVIVNPSPIVLEEYRFRQRQSELERARLARLRHTPAVTLDGEHVELHANIEMPVDAEAAVVAGATGVGLFRTEFLFMNRDGELPSEEEQFLAYKAAVEAMKGMPVTIRTVDVGADKPLDRLTVNELRHEHVLNPAMGLRAIRWSLAEPSMFRQQLRAIYRASAFGKVRLLVPMVAHLSEVRQITETIRKVQQQLTDAGHAFTRVELGVMIEIPAAAVMLPLLLRHVDFVSIGTNDLIQYTLAIDRADEAVAHLYDPWHPAVLQLISQSIAQARAAGKGVSVCGEMAGDPDFTELLLAMGLRSFSMHPSQIPAVKQRLLRSDAQRLAGVLPRLLESEDPRAVAEKELAVAKGGVAAVH
ncbi:phosphoenolpyruvate--protein phosphotransferase [Roseateles sp. BYS78W]|uniref:Phosphoenolpyruvate-protein phosphotransferase n=1 Tax=Pelomonas candidula TaxID=3299025 RepID=A0ABW7H547_9BURK